MDIDLTSLHSGTVEKLEINDLFEIPKEYYENTDIRSLDKVEVIGEITKKEDEEELLDYLNLKIKGKMIVPDSVSLDDLEYPFEIEYDDYLDKKYLKNENLLDILGLLWENIVLEIPLHLTEVEDYGKFKGDGWKLISEEDLKLNNNPFSDLLEDIEKE